ncbi:Eco57I restriction-modification methylase domain-containing protein [Belliella kenyensis]|uniref:site-specific DNA-methyltransferase (adenine-specific) n=1 Tax=Belliella kenyensis TaxID=1472724 RepID=A0ABV8EMT9_9BACT|nr:N-6 DNA methylase [Belliella kenyensis]MCH7400413.1 SAM-dependent methyltransferase [Belliella kenyensis]MDN3604570.1 N-6 DNA methylase [Belliella kenyensis]
MKKLNEIFSKLGLNKENGLFLTKEDAWKSETSFPNRVKRLIERKIEPDAFFCFDNKPMILFFENRENKSELHEAIWNFNECPIAIIVDKGTVEIFNGFNFLKENKSLEKLGEIDKLNDFTYFELVTGKTWEQYKEHLDYKNRVDYHLLQNIKAAREILVAGNEQRAKLVNAILGKVIFVRYLIDRKVKMKFDGKLRTWSNPEFCELLDNPQKVQAFFEYLEDKDKGFNGDLFPLSQSEYNQISKNDYQILKRLLLGDDIAKNQPSLFELYDFSIIPIEFISNVYELFIGQDNQKKEGAYYTPLFLVDYILKETVEKHLSDTRKLDVQINEILSKQLGNYSYCKVLDPACGSGIFLVETLRKIIEKYIDDTGIDTKSPKFKTAIKNLAKENIYGIDKDLSAVQVAIFSIYLTLLDYLEPAAIEDAFKFPHLLNTNFFEADFFDENAEFNILFKEIEFNYILGNPPWMRGKGEKHKPLFVEYIEKRRKFEIAFDAPKIKIGNKEIAQAFLFRSSDFSKSATKCSLIVTSKVLYNLQSNAFRKYFLHNFFIERVFELAPVRREVFDKSNDKAIAPACILFFNFAQNTPTDDNVIEHIALKPSRFFSLFKIFTINRTDFKEVQQSKLKEFDWLWKVLVYGSYLDFNFIKRLKSDYITLKDTIEKSNDLIIGQGVMVGGGDSNDASDLIGKPFIDTRSDIRQYWINPNNKKKWEYETVHRARNKELYKAPILLITEGVNNELKSVSAVCYRDSVYKSSLTGIKGRGKNTSSTLKQISGVLNSSFFSYFNLMTFSSSGIEREQSHDEEKLSIPFIENDNIASIVADIESHLFNHCSSENFLNDPSIEIEIQKKQLKLESCIKNSYSLTKEEVDLLDYTQQVIIPVIMRHSNYEKLFTSFKEKDVDLESYAQIFLNRFQSNLGNKNRKFIVEIWHTNQLIGMFFRVISAEEFKKEIIWKDNQHSDWEILSLLTKISSEKVTDKLFVQKDIRGFEKDYFYIFKPNEKRLWHKAIAYLDVNEFADAILKAGRIGK